MRRVEASPARRVPTGGTPTRTRHESAVVPPNILIQKPHKDSSLERGQVDGRTLSPNKLQATKKPVISPRVAAVVVGSNHQSKRWVCSNHQDREAEFKVVVVHGESMMYCERCAAHLASQGFKVERIQQSKYSERRTLSIGSNDKFQGNPRAAEIADFLEDLKIVDRSMRQNNKALLEVKTHYNLQIRQLEEFYNGVVCYVNYIRNEHVAQLKEEARRFVQLGLIECGTNDDNLEQINVMASDIQEGIESIVTKLAEDQFKHVLKEYSRNLEMYRHRLEEQNQMLSQVTDIRSDELEAKLAECKKALCDLLGVREQPFNSNNFSFEVDTHYHTTIKRNLHRGKENRNPFRNLFVEEAQNHCPDESPHFKPF